MPTDNIITQGFTTRKYFIAQ